MVTHDPEWLHSAPQEGIGYGGAVDGHVHGLPHLFLHKGHLGVQLVWRGKVESTKEPHVLDGREYATHNLHALGHGILLQGTIDIRDVHLFGQQRGQPRDPLGHPAELELFELRGSGASGCPPVCRARASPPCARRTRRGPCPPPSGRRAPCPRRPSAPCSRSPGRYWRRWSRQTLAPPV